MGQIHQLFLHFKKAYDLDKKEVWHNILIEFGISLKPVRLIEMCLNKTCSEVHIDKCLP